MRALRLGLVVLVAAPFAAGAAGGTAGARNTCAAPALSVGSALPAPVTVRTRCGFFEIGRDGHVHRLFRDMSPVAKRAFEYSPFTGVWSGKRDGRLVVGRWHRTLWRSRGTFGPDYEVGSIVLGRHALAFSYGIRVPRLYVATLDGPEHLVARGEYPLGWTHGGFYTWGRPHERLLLRAANGTLRKRIEPTIHSYAYSAGALWIVRNGWLLHARGAQLRRVAALRPLGLWPIRHLALEPLGRLVALEDGRRLVVLRADGSLFASTRLS
jgi:hypothetical protein